MCLPRSHPWMSSWCVFRRCWRERNGWAHVFKTAMCCSFLSACNHWPDKGSYLTPVFKSTKRVHFTLQEVKQQKSFYFTFKVRCIPKCQFVLNSSPSGTALFNTHIVRNTQLVSPPKNGPEKNAKEDFVYSSSWGLRPEGWWPHLGLSCSVTQSCPNLCDPMDCSTPGRPVHHQLQFTQTHVHWVGDAIQPSHPLSSPFPPALNLSQHQSLFQRAGFPHQVAKVLEVQLQHQSF